ncbi:MAG: prepilin-type N-terminal cleavage/methylation domain-containing protein [Elusimicrobia bacterium]|nr:prepilin-type N-terminal cleavage/methylation domain-containing protein [Elusimicrobiota bacterium]
MISATGNSGFTLLELSLVTFLLGIFAAVGWPALKGYADRSIARARAARFERRLRDARRDAFMEGVDRWVDARSERAAGSYCSDDEVHFRADGKADPFFWSAGSVDLEVTSDGRIQRMALHAK